MVDVELATFTHQLNQVAREISCTWLRLDWLSEWTSSYTLIIDHSIRWKYVSSGAATAHQSLTADLRTRIQPRELFLE